jgi:alpha-L-rhamnosidase
MAVRLVAAAAAVALAASAAPPLSRLRTEGLVTPLAVDAPAPRFTWTVDPTVTPAAAQVMVTAGTAPGGPAVWASPVLVGAAAAGAGVAFAGPPLSADTDYTWAVGVRDGPSGVWYNATTMFGVGLLAPSDWAGAAWVGGGSTVRGTFALPPGAVARARVYVTAVGCYALSVNGMHVARGGLNGTWPAGLFGPGFSTAYTARVLYDAYDVSAAVSAGAGNAVGVRLGSCKYGYLGEYCTADNATACNTALVLVTAVVGGTRVVVPSAAGGGGGAWTVANGAIVREHFYNGEVRDARLEQAGWDTPGFANASAWAPASAFPSPTAALSAAPMPPIAAIAPRPSVNVTALPGGDFVFDTGINGAGVCTLTLPGPVPAGAVVTLTFAELLAPNGSAFVQFPCPAACCADGGNCANQTYTYVTRGDPAGETYTPTFGYAAFRFVGLAGWPAALPPPTPGAVACADTSTAVDAAGGVTFNGTNGAILNAIQAAIVRSQRSNFHSIPTDCPGREKRGAWRAGGAAREGGAGTHRAPVDSPHRVEAYRHHTKALTGHGQGTPAAVFGAGR